MQGLLYAILALTSNNVFDMQAVSSIIASVLYAFIITLLRVYISYIFSCATPFNFAIYISNIQG